MGGHPRDVVWHCRRALDAKVFLVEMRNALCDVYCDPKYGMHLSDSFVKLFVLAIR